MSRTLLGLCATVALVGAGAAFAQSDTTTKTQPGTSTGSTTQHQQDSMGTSDKATGTSMPGQLPHQKDTLAKSGNNELTGTVVKADAKMVWIDHMGMVVPLQINASTRFDDPSVKRAKDLKEGQEIRASFMVKNRTVNVAQSISLSETGRGGSGLDDLRKDKSDSDVGVPMDEKMDDNLGTGGPGPGGIGGSGIGDEGSVDDGNVNDDVRTLPDHTPDLGEDIGNSGQMGSGSSSDQRTY